MIQMDANTRKLGKKTETWDIVYIIVPALLYNASSSSFFIYLFIFL